VPEHPVSQTGDLWLLGRHRLLCGDSTLATDVERVLGGVSREAPSVRASRRKALTRRTHGAKAQHFPRPRVRAPARERPSEIKDRGRPIGSSGGICWPNWPAHNAAFAVTPAEAGSAFVR
jgi:hypothetical protein